MHNFQKLNWSGELSYVEGQVEVVSPDHDASDYFNPKEKRILILRCYYRSNVNL